MFEEIKVSEDIEFGRDGMLNRLRAKGGYRLSWLQEQKHEKEFILSMMKRDIKDIKEEIAAIDEGIAANS